MKAMKAKEAKESVQPMESVQPIPCSEPPLLVNNSSEPSEPFEPSEPSELSDPSKPSKPSEPSKPSKPSKPPKPPKPPTKKDTLQSMRTTLEGWKGRIITSDSPHWELCMTYLGNHPTWKGRLDDIEKIKVHTSKLNGCLNVSLWLKEGKRWTLISWRKCVQTHKRKSSPNALPPSVTPRNLLVGAMRSAIRRQIRQFQQANRFTRACANVECQSEEKGGTTQNHKHRSRTFHVDHIVPFSQLAEEFLQANPDPPTTFAFRRQTGQPIFTRQERGFRARWQNFHRKHATYQWLCRTCNLQKSNK